MLSPSTTLRTCLSKHGAGFFMSGHELHSLLRHEMKRSTRSGPFPCCHFRQRGEGEDGGDFLSSLLGRCAAQTPGGISLRRGGAFASERWFCGASRAHTHRVLRGVAPLRRSERRTRKRWSFSRALISALWRRPKGPRLRLAA